MRHVSLLFATVFATSLATTYARADQIAVFGAGSLRKVMTELGMAFSAKSSVTIHGEYGPSGYMANRIVKDEKIDLFASADMTYPTKLEQAGLAGPVVMFARSNLCILAKRDLHITSANFVSRLLAVDVKVGTTAAPVVGPLGHYTNVLLRRIDERQPGIAGRIQAKLIQLPDARDENVTNGRRPEVSAFASGKVNAVIAYCATAKELEPQIPATDTVQIPPSVRVGADYGLTLVKGAKPAAAIFALFILSERGQRILAKEAYEPVTLPKNNE